MNRIDRAVVGILLVVLAIAAVAIGGPALSPASHSSAAPAQASGPAAALPYREGILGRPTSVNPLAARTQADRDLVALVFEGLVTRGPDGRPVAGLARSWTTSTSGDSWTFQLDPDAHWTDGEPVTAADVVFTIETIQDGDYHGPGAGSWAGITVDARDATTVVFSLATPIGGFLDLATQPIAPRHLLGDVGAAAMGDDPFGETPIGSGPYAIAELDREHAVLIPSASAEPDATEPSPAPSTSSSPDPLVTPRPTTRPDSPSHSLSRLEFRFFDDATTLSNAFKAGELDVVSGLDPGAAIDLASDAGTGPAGGATTLRDPSTTIATVALNLRPTHVEFADPRMRRALLQAIDRTRIASVVYGGGALQADGLIPPTSWAFSSAETPTIKRDLVSAAKGLVQAGWKKAKDGWRREDAKEPQALNLLVPNRAANPILFAVGSQIAADWTALGFAVNVREEDPAAIATDHLRTGEFDAAVIDIAIGHDPDLYPLLASTQTRTGGANVVGLQDPLLDGLLEAARKPGTEMAREAAFAALQKRLTGGTYLLPIAWPDVVAVVSNRVTGTAIRPVADGSERFLDVLTWRLADDR